MGQAPSQQAQRFEATIHHRAGDALFVEAQTILLPDDRRLVILRDQSQSPFASGDRGGEPAQEARVERPLSLALVSADEKKQITAWNHAARPLFGYTTEEAIGMSLEELIPPALRAEHRHAFQERMKHTIESDYAQVITTSALRKDGTEFPADIAMRMSRRVCRY